MVSILSDRDLDAMADDIDAAPLVEALRKFLHHHREREIEHTRLRYALEQSLKLQAHYATLLNQYDGGKRLAFTEVDAWLRRLKETTYEPGQPES